MEKSTNCPCASGKLYAKCCARLHRGKQAAASAEALMRSRYAAYALGKVGYIIKTTHPVSPHRQADIQAWRRELKQFCTQTEFVSLTILATNEQPAQATVHFRAGLLQAGRDASFTENSLFKKVDGRWLYVEAID